MSLNHKKNLMIRSKKFELNPSHQSHKSNGWKMDDGIPAKWHKDRAAKIISEFPDIEKLKQPFLGTLFVAIAVVVFRLWVLWLCPKNVFAVLGFGFILSLLEIVFFGVSHETCHGNINSYFQKPQRRDILLGIISFDFFHAWIYLYCKHGHIAHHVQLGRGSQEDTPDGDLLKKSLVPVWSLAARRNEFQNVTGFIPRDLISRVSWYPIYHTCAEIAKNVKEAFVLIVYVRSVYSLWCVLNLIAPLLFGLYAGPLAFAFCELVSNSPLHPKFAFLQSVHASTFESGVCQPTMSNYGGMFWDWLHYYGNHHVEHHDFPNIPCWRLPILKKRASSYYTSIHSFSGYFDVVSRLVTQDQWIYSCHSSQEH